MKNSYNLFTPIDTNKNFIRAFVAIFKEMKKIATTLFMLSMVFCWVQISNAQCVQCDTSSHATGYYSSVLGVGNLASGETSLASGMSNTSSGDYSSSLGYGNIAEGMYSFAGGENCVASGKRAFAFGRYAVSESSISLALGSFNRAYGTNAIAMGCFVEATNENAVVIGRGSGDTSRIVNNKSNTMMVGFNSNLHTFFIDRASGRNTTGRVGIGNVIDPEAKLHILGDNDPLNTDDASLLIESAGNRYSTIYLGDQNHYIKTKPGHDLMFNAGNHNFQFLNGNTGFGTDDPQAKVHVKEGDIFIEDIDHGIVMKSPNGSCWRGTVTDEGQLQFTEVDCDDLMVSTPEPEPGQNSGIRIYPNPTGNRVFVETGQEWIGATLVIKDTNGARVSAEELHNTESFIDMSGFQPGVYIFRITAKEGQNVISKKVIKN